MLNYESLAESLLTVEWHTYADLVEKLSKKFPSAYENGIDPIHEISHAVNRLCDEGKADKRSPVRGNGFPIAFRLSTTAI